MSKRRKQRVAHLVDAATGATMVEGQSTLQVEKGAKANVDHGLAGRYKVVGHIPPVEGLHKGRVIVEDAAGNRPRDPKTQEDITYPPEAFGLKFVWSEEDDPHLTLAEQANNK